VTVLFWNEGRSVRRSADIEAGRAAVVHVDAGRVDNQHDGKLVHLSAEVTGAVTLQDEKLDFRTQGLRLRRQVEMYQWQENRQSGSDNQNEYTYSKTWSENLITSDDFHESGHTNPDQMPLSDRTYNAPDIKVGAYTLSEGLVRQIDNFEPLPIKEQHVEAASDSVEPPTHLDEEKLYMGDDPDNPAVGDARVALAVAKPTTVSLVGQQQDSMFAAWPTPAGRELDPYLEVGQHSAAALFDRLAKQNVALTWALRVGGCLLAFFGAMMVFGPVLKASQVVPVLGDVAAAGTCLVASVGSAVLSLVVISAAWLYYRPTWAIGLFVIALAVGGGVVWHVRRSADQSAEA